MDLHSQRGQFLDRRDKEDGGQLFLELLKDPFHGQLAAASVYSAFGISLGFTVFIAICFSFLRPYNQAVYAPKLKHADEKHAPPPIGKKPWSWLKPVLNTREAVLVQQIGMDATIFLRFMSMCRDLFLVLAFLGLAILVPVNALKSDPKLALSGSNTYKWLDIITPRAVFGSAIWSQVVVAYLFDIVIAGFLWWNYRKIAQLRRAHFNSDEYQRSLHSRTLMLYDIPRDGCSDEGIARIIDGVVPHSSFARTAIARNVKDLPQLIHEHDRNVRKLEKVLAKYLKNPGQLPAARPSCKPSKKDRSFDTYPSGQRVDAIEYYSKRIRDLEVEIKEVRASVDRRSTMPYGFASYAEITEAHNIAYACRKKKPNGTTIGLAPLPSDIIWRNMSLAASSRRRRRMVNTLWISILTLIWIGPNAMIAIFLVNLSNLGKVWPAFNTSLQKDTTFWGVVQGIASPAITSLVYLVLPIIFRRLSMRAGDQTKTGRERHVVARLYAFFIFNNLIVFSIFSTLWSFISGVVQSTQKGTNAWKAIWDGNIAVSIFLAFCQNSPFWVTYLLQRQLGAAIDLAQFWPLIQAFFLKKFSSPTPRELIELTAPPPFEYASYYTYFLFYSTVTLCFAGIQPLVLVPTALYFCIDSYLKKYLILYRFVTKTESGGLFWRIVFNRFIFGTVLSNLVVLLTCWTRGIASGAYRPQFYAVCPLPFFMIAFKFYCCHTFDNSIRYYSTSAATRNVEEAAPNTHNLHSERLASKFGNPALYKKLITPMVHQRAQNLLPSVYTGRLTDGREAGAADLMSVSGYSDMYALDSMQGGKLGKAAADGVPGFEFVSEDHMDFQYYKNRAEFTEEHGGGEMYGRGDDIKRTGTPGSLDELTDLAYSRPGTPLSGRGNPMGPRRVMTGDTSYQSYRPVPNQGYASPPSNDFQHHAPMGSEHINRGRSPLYAQDNNSASALVSNAANVPIGPAIHGSREGSVDRGGRGIPGVMSPPMTHGASAGALGGGPHGYSGLAQSEEPDGQSMAPDQYNYFRQGSRPTRPPGEGW